MNRHVFLSLFVQVWFLTLIGVALLSASAAAQVEISLKDGRIIRGSVQERAAQVLKVSVYSETRRSFSVVNVPITEIVSVFDPIADRDVTSSYIVPSAKEQKRAVSDSSGVVPGTNDPTTRTNASPPTIVPPTIVPPTIVPPTIVPPTIVPPSVTPPATARRAPPPATPPALSPPATAPPSATRSTAMPPQANSAAIDTMLTAPKLYTTLMMGQMLLEMRESLTQVTLQGRAYLMPEGFRRGDEYRTYASENVQASGIYGGLIQIGPVYEGSPAEYAISATLLPLVGEALNFGGAGLYQASREMQFGVDRTYSTFVVAPMIKLYPSRTLAVSFQLGAGRNELSLESMGVTATESSARYQFEHELWLRVGRQLGYHHSFVMKRMDPMIVTASNIAAYSLGVQSVSLTNAIELAVTRRLSLIGLLTTSAVQLTTWHVESLGALPVKRTQRFEYALAPGAGIALSLSDAMTLLLQPQCVLRERGDPVFSVLGRGTLRF